MFVRKILKSILKEIFWDYQKMRQIVRFCLRIQKKNRKKTTFVMLSPILRRASLCVCSLSGLCQDIRVWEAQDMDTVVSEIAVRVKTMKCHSNHSLSKPALMRMVGSFFETTLNK